VSVIVQLRLWIIIKMTSPSVEDSVASLMQLTDDELLGRIGREAKGELAEVGMAEGPFDYLVTAILVKRVFHPAGQELCAFWAQRLSKHR
jgi:hypothetical protein